ncbi:MAG: DUF1013 domain-containing protein [Rickettsiales bacterium]|nr:DUF1013 domain-containing protein [Rickettsiales bacterium]
MNLPLMPKATAVWLVSNTSLTFDQIADFCGLHPLEIQGIADGDVASGIVGDDPIISGQLTREEIKRCEQDPNAKLKLVEMSNALRGMKKTRKEPKYIPVARRQDKPDGVLWLIRKYPDIEDSKIIKLLGTTKKTILAIRSRTHWNIAKIKPRDPVLLGLCSQVDLDKVVKQLEEVVAKREDDI